MPLQVSIAGAYYGIPKEIRETALGYLDDILIEILIGFEELYLQNR